jgi:hypothetical protein
VKITAMTCVRKWKHAERLKTKQTPYGHLLPHLGLEVKTLVRETTSHFIIIIIIIIIIINSCLLLLLLLLLFQLASSTVLIGPWPSLMYFSIHRHLVGLLGWGISPTQGLYRNTGQHSTETRRHTSMPRARFESAISMFKRS